MTRKGRNYYEYEINKIKYKKGKGISQKKLLIIMITILYNFEMKNYIIYLNI
jgi:uncharacterized membrane protein YwzB